MNRNFNKRLRRLEGIRIPTLDSPVIIELLETGEREIYTLVNGKKKIFTDEEWRKSGNKLAFEVDDWNDDILVFVDDVSKED